MSPTNKGNELEDAFYRYLVEQQESGDLVFGVYAPQNCKVFKKKSYYCRDREADVEFDVVLEIYRTGSETPHLYVFFECKNHRSSVPDIYIREFSSKIGSIFPNASKGVMVVASRLQSGAEMVARNRSMGIVKFDEHGLEIVAERKDCFMDNGFLRAQIFQHANIAKSLKISGYYDGKYFSSIRDLLAELNSETKYKSVDDSKKYSYQAPFLSEEQIMSYVTKILEFCEYKSGVVDLPKVCRNLEIDLQFSHRKVIGIDGVPILGGAVFGRDKVIIINSHSLETRERFTIAHEIGHFVLNHEKYLRSESIVENDLFISDENKNMFNYDRLEYQANMFASELILPYLFFVRQTAQFRKDLGIRNRGHGYIFVDDQPCNFSVYDELLSRLSNHFHVSKQAIEVKLRRSRMLTDQRKRNETPPVASLFSGMAPRCKG